MSLPNPRQSKRTHVGCYRFARGSTELGFTRNRCHFNLRAEMKRILLVEDDDAIRRSLEIVLAKSGFVVVEAANGREAQAAYQPGQIDAVVLDLIMPDVGGLETLRALRRISRDVRILAISGGGKTSSTDYLDMALKSGAQEALAKPFTSETFIEALNRLLASPTAATVPDVANSAARSESPPSARM